MTAGFGLAVMLIFVGFFAMLEGHLIFAFLMIWFAIEVAT